jgi:hypothetical protein
LLKVLWEAIVRENQGIIAKSNLKYISGGFIISTSSPKPDPVYYLQLSRKEPELYYYKF